MKSRIILLSSARPASYQRPWRGAKQLSSSSKRDIGVSDSRSDAHAARYPIDSTEYEILESLLLPREQSREYSLPFVRQIKRLRLLEERKRPLSNRLRSDTLLTVQHPMSATAALSEWGRNHSKFGEQQLLTELSPEMLNKIDVLVSKRTLLTSDIDSWLKIHITASDSLAVRKHLLVQALDRMISHCSPTSIYPLLDFLASMWTRGFESAITVPAKVARAQVVAVLNRALHVFPATEYSIDHNDIVAQVGIENMDLFNQLVEKFTKKFGPEQDPVVEDLLFQLVSKCGTIEAAENIVTNKYLTAGQLPSFAGIDAFSKTLSKHISLQRVLFSGTETEFNLKVKHDVAGYRDLLVSDRVTPAVVEFLLVWVSDLREVYSILELVSNANHADYILSRVQVPIINTVVKCSVADSLREATEQQAQEDASQTAVANPRVFTPYHTRAMAHMFGVLNRFSKCSAGITAEALDQCLLLSAQNGNSAGMYRALAMRLDLLKKSEVEVPPIKPEILGAVFDSFPIASGAMAQEKKASKSMWAVKDAIIADPARDQAILYHLRTTIDPSHFKIVFEKYLGALGRCSRSDRLYWEWTEFLDSKLDWSASPDLVLSFISAFKTAGAVEQGLSVLGYVLEESDRRNDVYYNTAVGILKQVFRYEILPLSASMGFVADWFIRNKQNTKWSGSDIEQSFNEIGGPHSISSLSPDEVRAASYIGKEITRTILEVRGGLDVDQSLASLHALLQRHSGSPLSV